MSACPQCRREFEPRRPHQVYCRKRCRMAHYAVTRGDGALRGTVRSVKVCSQGDASVTLRFSATDRDNALLVMPGMVVEIFRQIELEAVVRGRTPAVRAASTRSQSAGALFCKTNPMEEVYLPAAMAR